MRDYFQHGRLVLTDVIGVFLELAGLCPPWLHARGANDWQLGFANEVPFVLGTSSVRAKNEEAGDRSVGMEPT